MSDFFISGLASGLDTAAIVDSLMSVERLPMLRLQQRKASFESRISAWTALETKTSALQTAVNALKAATGFNVFSTTSTDENLLTASATESAAPGAITFRIQQLAASHQVTSAGFSSRDALVGAGTGTIGRRIANMGFESVVADGTLAAGRYTVEVTSVGTSGAPTSAELTSGSLSFPFNVNASNDRVNLLIDGSTNRSVRLPRREYTDMQDLADEFQNDIGSSATVTVENGLMVIRSNTTGSSSEIEITGGDNLVTQLGWSFGQTESGSDAGPGGDSTVVVNGTEYQVATTGPGGEMVVDTGSGTLTFTVGAEGVKVGDGELAVVQTDDTTTLTQLTTSLKSAGMSAQLVDIGSGTSPWQLVMTATQTGTDNAMAVDFTDIAAFGGGFTDVRAAADAQITLGAGAGALTITRQSNSITDLLDGVTIDLHAADATKDVTVNVARDAAAITEKVKAVVEGMNALLAEIKAKTAYDTEAGTGQVLSGETRVRDLAGRIRSALTYSDAGNSLSVLSQIGISVQRDGTYSLDEAKLGSALNEDFDGVVDLLAEDLDAGTDGVFGTLSNTLKSILDIDGLIDNAKDGAQATADRIQDQIESYEFRLEKIELRYRRQFTALETLLGTLSTQSQWLASQLRTLPNPSAA